MSNGTYPVNFNRDGKYGKFYCCTDLYTLSHYFAIIGDKKYMRINVVML